jgi:MSHA biogenesis protein MshL
MNRTLACMLAFLLAACAEPPPRQSGLDPTIRRELHADGARKPEPVRSQEVETALLPPLRMELPQMRGGPIDQRFDLSVSNAPASQVFASLVSGTRFSMLVHPAVTGNISVNLKDVTLAEALDSIRELYGYDYKIEGTRIHVQAAGLQSRVFKVNYLTGQRRGTSDVRVQSSAVSDVTASAPTGAPGSPGGATPGAPVAASRAFESARVSTRSDSDFWAELRTALTTIVGSGEGRSVVLSPQAGIAVVRALPSELRAVEHYLRAAQLSLDRQVMLEAKIIEVTLNDSYQSGVNWAAFANHRVSVGQLGQGTVLQRGERLQATGATFSTDPATGQGIVTNPRLTSIPGRDLINHTVVGAGVSGLAVATANFAVLLQFLETQGNVQVLSSPRIATMNNQKAVLKVGTDQFFVTNITSTSSTSATTTGAVAATPIPSVTVQPFFSGIVLDVTPQIDDNNQIILHVHPSVSQVTTDNKVISLGNAGELNLPLARSDVSETDTIVRVSDGNLVALGGLMKVELRDTRSGLPGAPDSFFSNLFLRNTERQVVKKELVILIKPTITQSDRVMAEQVDEARDRLEALDDAMRQSQPRPRSR